MKINKPLLKVIALLLFCTLGLSPAPDKDYAGNGFTFALPTAYRLIDNDLNNSIFVFSSPYSILKVFTQDLKNISAQTYIEYGNYQLYTGKAGFKVIDDRSRTVNGYQVREMSYHRPLI